jgi:AcrR family transcriptional regulator
VGRPPRFPAEAILDTARDLTARRGVGGLTMSAVATELGAPSGSVYRRLEAFVTTIGPN